MREKREIRERCQREQGIEPHLGMTHRTKQDNPQKAREKG
jgi:hypothetical protein